MPVNGLPETASDIEKAIIRIADAMKELNKTRLTQEALVVLIQAKTKLKRNDIEKVLESLEYLERNWLKPARKRGKKL